MRLQFVIAFGIVLFLFFACHHSESSKVTPSKDTVNTRFDNKKDEAAIIDSINHLIDITYDKPDQIIAGPDLFINRIKILPNSPLGKRSYTLLLLNIGYVLREHGLILASTRFYERALNYYTKNQLRQPDFILYIAKPLANLYTRIDDIQKSIALHQKAIQIATQNKQFNYLPSLYNNLAIAYQTNGQFGQVIISCRKGLTYTPAKSIYNALLSNSLAFAYLQKNQTDSSVYYNKRALQLFQSYQLKKDTLIWYSGALKLESDLARDEKNYSKAIHSIDKAITLISTHFPRSRQRVKAKYFVARGQLTLHRAPHAAIRDFQSAIQLLNNDAHSFYVSDYTYTDALYGLARAYIITDKDSALYYYAKTIENDYLTQELIVSKASNYKNAGWNRKILAEYAGLLLSAYQNTKQKKLKQAMALRLFWAIEMSKGRQIQREINRSRHWSSETNEEDSLRNRLKDLYRNLAVAKDPNTTRELKEKISKINFKFQLSEKYFEQAFQSIDFNNFKKFLLKKSRSQALVSYLIQENGKGYIVCINNQTAKVYTVKQNQNDTLNTRNFITNYFGDNPYPYENNPDLYLENAQKLTNTYLPFVGHIQKELILSPDGILFKLPMDALIYQDKYIVESYTLSYTYSFILDYLHQSKRTYQSDILFFGKSKYKDTFKDLTFVEDEKEMIADRFKGSVFEDSSATAKAFISNLHKNDIIHLATHAVSEPQPYLVFNKPLTLESLSIIDMQSPLVILSACESADGKLIKAEGLESLNKAFISKGVRGVIAAQWPVDDRSIAKLMGLFYQNLYRLKNPVQALTTAKRSFLKQEKVVYRNPWYWASMNYMGIETQIRIRKKKPIWMWGGLILLTGLSLFVYLRRRRKRR